MLPKSNQLLEMLPKSNQLHQCALHPQLALDCTLTALLPAYLSIQFAAYVGMLSSLLLHLLLLQSLTPLCSSPPPSHAFIF